MTWWVFEKNPPQAIENSYFYSCFDNSPLLFYFSPPVFIGLTSFLFHHQAPYHLITFETLLILIYSWAFLYTGRLEKIDVFFPPPSQGEKNKFTGDLYHKEYEYFIALLLSSQKGDCRVWLIIQKLYHSYRSRQTCSFAVAWTYLETIPSPWTWI